MAGCGWSLLTILSGATPVAAQEHRVTLDLPAGLLPDSIAALARQSGASIGAATQLPSEPTPRLRGAMTVDQALHRLLRRSALRAVRLGPAIYRLEPRPIARPSPAVPTLPPERAAPSSDEIVVTATKRREALSDVAAPIAVVAGRAIAGDYGEGSGTRDLTQGMTGLFATNLGPGRNRLFVRGIADSPFDGFGQAAVSVQVDEARATYDAPDPDLRLYDVAQVELLKGPQGPLYGTGALGGVYRLVPAKPDLRRLGGSVQSSLETVGGGGVAGAVDAAINVPILDDRLAVRAVGYRSGQAGWIDEAGTGRRVNHGVTSGGRVALRARVGERWTVDLSGLTQSTAVADSQYVDGDAGALARPHRLPEPQDTDFALAAATATGPIGPLTFTGSASIAMQELRATYDASAAAAALGATGPASYVDDRRYQVINAEARVTARTGRFKWLAGGSVLSAATDATGTIGDVAGATQVLAFQRRVSEVALFGEGTFAISDRLSATVGGRLFRSQTQDERRERDRGNDGVNSATMRLTPSATVSWRPGRETIIYARYASALRPGGADASGPGSGSGTAVAAYTSDELTSFDLGARAPVGSGVALDADLFTTNWRGVQADYLDTNGLVSTRNAGDANNIGVDVSVTWAPGRAWTVALGTILQRARIDPTGITEQLPDRRLPAVPDASARLELARDLIVGAWQLRLIGRANYVGASRLSFDPGLDRRTPDTVTVAGAVDASRGPWRIRAGADNLLDTHADSFGFGNPFSVRTASQRTPVKPRTVSLSLGRAW